MRAGKGRNNGVTLYKKIQHTNSRLAGRGINRGGVKHTVNFPGLSGRKVSGRTPGNQFVKVRRGRR